MDRSNATEVGRLYEDSNEETLKLLSFAYKYIFSWLVPFQYVAGCFGTILCIVVLVRRHSTQKEVRPWFITLSIMDLYVMTIGLPMMYLSVVQMLVALNAMRAEAEHGGNRTGQEQGSAKELNRYNLRNWSEFTCYGITILQYYGLVASSWVQVGISLLRCLSTVVPLSSRSRINVRSSRKALCTTLLVTLTVSITVVMSTLQYEKQPAAVGSGNGTSADGGGAQEIWVCTQKWKSPYYLYSTLVLRVFLPAVCLIVSTSVILYSMHKFKRAFHAEARRRTQQQRRISLILIGMNTTFLLFALPYEVYLIYASGLMKNYMLQGPKQAAVLKIVENVFAILMYTNNATNWIFYFVLGKRFRQEIRRTMTCTKTRVSKTVHYRFRMGPKAAENHHYHHHNNNSLIGNNKDGCCRSSRAGVDYQMELQPLQDSPIGETRQAHSLDTARCHANHRVCHVNFKLSSV